MFFVAASLNSFGTTHLAHEHEPELQAATPYIHLKLFQRIVSSVFVESHWTKAHLTYVEFLRNPSSVSCPTFLRRVKSRCGRCSSVDAPEYDNVFVAASALPGFTVLKAFGNTSKNTMRACFPTPFDNLIRSKLYKAPVARHVDICLAKSPLKLQRVHSSRLHVLRHLRHGLSHGRALTQSTSFTPRWEETSSRWRRWLLRKEAWGHERLEHSVHGKQRVLPHVMGYAQQTYDPKPDANSWIKSKVVNGWGHAATTWWRFQISLKNGSSPFCCWATQCPVGQERQFRRPSYEMLES